MNSTPQNCFRCAECILAMLGMLLALTPLTLAQAVADASLHAAVRDLNGKSVVDATLYLQLLAPRAAMTAQALNSRTDDQGNCSFSNLPPGEYALRVEKTGYTASTVPNFFLSAKESKRVDITMGTEKTTPPAAGAEFFDAPHFTVSGVTDTTSIGGHGSDAVVRSRESLAKDTAALSGTSLASVAPSAGEVSLREKAERDPTNFAANRDLGRLLLDDGKPRAAVNYLEAAAKIARDQALLDQAELHHLLAHTRERLGDPLAAVREYQEAAELEPSEANLFDWGSELLLHHAPEPALEVFSKGNRQFPQSGRMLMGLGAAWFASGSFDRAVEFIDNASDLNPADPVPYRFLGAMQSTQTLVPDALVDRLRRFATLNPQNAAANYYFAVALWKQRKASSGTQDPAFMNQVESLLRTALRLEPEFGAAYLQLGILFAEQKNFSQALLDYKQALHSDPLPGSSPIADLKMTDVQVQETHYRLAQAYREIGETDKAKTELQLYDQITKKSAEQIARQRREVGQFVYTLRDEAAPSH